MIRIKALSRDHTIIPTGSTAVVLRDDSGPWTYGTIIEHGMQDHGGRIYKIQITKMACSMMMMVWHVKLTPIIADQYFRDYVTKAKNHSPT